MEQEVMEMERKLSYGEKMVGITFNPSKESAVDRIKIKTAELIDELNDLRTLTDNSEEKRMYSIAITEIQSVQMWGVRAVTWRF